MDNKNRKKNCAGVIGPDMDDNIRICVGFDRFHHSEYVAGLATASGDNIQRFVII